MADLTVDAEAIKTRYREYCNACQGGHLEKLTTFWALPAMFVIDYGGPATAKKVVSSAEELQELYAKEFGRATGIDKTTIDTEDVKFLSGELATIETTLRHTVKADLHDKQHAVYCCRKVDGLWWFDTHISKVENSPHPA